MLRGNKMIVDGDSAGLHTNAKVSPSAYNNNGEPTKGNTIHQWPASLELRAEGIDGHGTTSRNLQGGACGVFAEGQYFDQEPGACYNLGGYWWNDRITHVRSSSNTCIQLWEDEGGGEVLEYCGDEWFELDGTLSKEVSRICCPESSGGGGGGGVDGIDGEWLAAHNSRRSQWYAQHGLGNLDLKWSQSLKDSAQNYANKLITIGGGDECRIEHGFQGDKFGGENLASNSGGNDGSSPESVMQRWYDGEINLSFGENLHATQVVYRSSHYVGCASSEKDMNSGGKCFIQVCRYLAPGNCNINADNWVANTLGDDVVCGPECPPEGCF